MIANSHEEILKYYKSELTYLRRMGGVFAEPVSFPLTLNSKNGTAEMHDSQ